MTDRRLVPSLWPERALSCRLVRPAQPKYLRWRGTWPSTVDKARLSSRFASAHRRHLRHVSMSSPMREDALHPYVFFSFAPRPHVRGTGWDRSGAISHPHHTDRCDLTTHDSAQAQSCLLFRETHQEPQTGFHLGPKAANGFPTSHRGQVPLFLAASKSCEITCVLTCRTLRGFGLLLHCANPCLAYTIY